MGNCTSKKIELTMETLAQAEYALEKENYKALAKIIAQFYVQYDSLDAKSQEKVDIFVAKSRLGA